MGVVKLREREPQQYLQKALCSLGVKTESSRKLSETLPFSLNDTTSGSESELQTLVKGVPLAVDLPRTILNSSYIDNIKKRQAAGEMPNKVCKDLEKVVFSNKENIWENSRVRFPRGCLNSFADGILDRDLLADKSNPALGKRNDTANYLIEEKGEEYLRIPVSYLIKLSLADFLGSLDNCPAQIYKAGKRLLSHFSNDNTSPETSSFYISPVRPETNSGAMPAEETSKRFLLTHLLVSYANIRFGLKKSGQHAMVYSSPLPPVRQEELNECMSDSFYRELFMNPCLSGWDRGEEKYAYMHLCHEVLSRSKLNSIITNNLVLLPNTSNISLANNGTHISIGSIKLLEALGGGSTAFTTAHEKYMGDLAIKIMEHFLPLFVGTYTAAPRRMEFYDFHPETALGFLPHELHHTHLQMIWRRWKKKAKLKILKKSVTPFGPSWVDRPLNRLFRFKGDFIPDFRLIDYLVSLLSTENHSALDGIPGSEKRLKKDLMQMGVFNPEMPLYLFYKLREYSSVGFSGFEGRHYSLFKSITSDMTCATNLQVLITALAYKYMAKGELDHRHIPDSPFIESERRQITFGAAINIPTFFVRKDSLHPFMRKILKHTKRVRNSQRYQGYLRVYNREYQKALVEIVEKDAADLIEMLGFNETMADLKRRIDSPEEYSSFHNLSKAILEKAGHKSPYSLSGGEFNAAAESYYREDLKESHLEEALESLKRSLGEGARAGVPASRATYNLVNRLLGGRDAALFIGSVQGDVCNDTVKASDLQKLISLTILDIGLAADKADSLLSVNRTIRREAASVY